MHNIHPGINTYMINSIIKLIRWSTPMIGECLACALPNYQDTQAMR